MADYFFGFDTSLNRGDEYPDDLDNDEQEYDALNEETFGCDDNGTDLDDWETQHEQLAEIAECSKFTHTIEESINQLVLDEDSDEKQSHTDSSIWSTSSAHTNNVKLTPRQNEKTSYSDNSSFFNHNKLPPLNNGLSLPKNVCTVEELERNLLTQNRIGNSVTPAPPTQQQQQHQQQQQKPGKPFVNNFIQHNQPPQFPPGLNPMLLQRAPYPPPHHVPPGLQPAPGLLRFMAPPPHHPLLIHHAQQQGVKGMMPSAPGPMAAMRPNFPMPQPNYNYQDYQNQAYHHHHPQQHQQQQRQYHQHHHQQQYNRSLPPNGRNAPMPKQQQHASDIYDEYAGLMTNREKQWLINIQLLQLNTGTPYFDDFYYTVFVRRQSKLEKENSRPNIQDSSNQRNNRFNQNQNNRKDGFYYKDGNIGHHDRDWNHSNRSDRGDCSSQTQINKIYTPLQFENSLGKLQCGSVTAPRKIIDMDVVSHDADGGASSAGPTQHSCQRDVRKTKQTLLELETLFALILRLEDLSNPVAIANSLKLREIREKQKIQQLESATAEQKDEILKQLQDDTLVRTDNKDELLARIVAGLLADDKFSGYVSIRKGKVLLLRLLPYLNNGMYLSKFIEMWIKLFISLVNIGKKDQQTDNILPKFYPFFERFIEHQPMEVINNIASSLIETRKVENARHTPNPHLGKPVLYFVLSNKLGLSCTVRLIERCEILHSNSLVTDKQHRNWVIFLTCIHDAMSLSDYRSDVDPIRPMVRHVLEKHLRRAPTIGAEKHSLFFNAFCENK